AVGRGRGSARRRVDAEARAAAGLGGDRDPAAVSLCDRLRDHEPEPGARDRLLRRRRRAEEALEQPLLLAVGNADPGVLDLDDRVLAVDEGPRRYAAVARRELERGREQVGDELCGPLAARAQRRRAGPVRVEPEE